jgi:MFS family permease
MLALLSLAELLGMSLWFTGVAVAPQLAGELALTDTQVGLLSTAVQLGFVAGTALSAVFNLADIVAAKRLFAVAALLGAVANAAMLWMDSFALILACRALTGACLAGVYPPAMKMAATWFKERRGIAVGAVVGALTVGKAVPYLFRLAPELGMQEVVFATSASALVAAVLIGVAWKDGPFAFPARPFSWGLVGEVVGSQRWRLATGGYLGHMAELYSYWTWIAAFVAASAVAAASAAGAADPASAASAWWVGALSFGTIAVGGFGCLWGGLLSDRIGRERLVVIAMAASGACALLIGLLFGRSPLLLAPVALAWGFFVIADSAQFSVLVTESVEPHAVGTALTVQVCLGFLLTTLTIQAVPPVVARVGWEGAFAMLAIGPVLGIVAIRRLQRLSSVTA